MFDRWKKILTAVVLAALLCFCGCAHPHSFAERNETGRLWTPGEIAAEFGGEDPYEGFNRTMFGAQRIVMDYLVRPLGWVYASIIPKFLQKGIANIGDNAAYPRRLFSALGMGKFSAAGWESLRFLTNTTVGLAGFFDVADDWFDIYPRNEDFGQAFAAWGMAGGPMLVVPGLMGANLRDASGAVLDAGFDPRSYLFLVGVPAVTGADMFNSAVYRYRTFKRLVDSSSDPYDYYKMFLILFRHIQNRDMLEDVYAQRNDYYKLYRKGMVEPLREDPGPDRPEDIQGRFVHLLYYGSEHPALDTLRSSLLVPQTDEISLWSHLGVWNSDFTSRARLGSLQIDPERPELPFYHWKQPDDPAAPLIVLIPGIGGDYNGSSVVALAEVLVQNGYQCVTLSNSCNWRFIESALESEFAGYTEADARDMRRVVALAAADVERVNQTAPRSRVLGGYSLGGLLTLYMAAEESPEALNFDRYIAINPPMNLLHALKTADSYGEVSRRWTREEALTLIPEAVMSYYGIASSGHAYFDHEAGLLGKQASSPASYRVPVSIDQARYGIWASFKLTMRDMVAEAVKKHGELDGIETPYSWGGRTKLYREIEQLDFMDYLNRFLLPGHRRSSGNPDLTLDGLVEGMNGYGALEKVKNDPRVRILHNYDDIFISESDREFIDSRMRDRVIWFDHGGHLGNMYMVQWHNNFLAAIEHRFSAAEHEVAPASGAFASPEELADGVKIAVRDLDGQRLLAALPPDSRARLLDDEHMNEADVLVLGIDPEASPLVMRSRFIKYIMPARELRGAAPKLLLIPTKPPTAEGLWNLQLLKSSVNNMLSSDYCRVVKYSTDPYPDAAGEIFGAADSGE